MKKVLKYIMIAILVVAVLGTFVFLYKKSQPVVKKYEVAEVTMSEIAKKTIATGKVEPRNEIAVKPQISGIIDEIYMEAGDKVKVGDIIAKIKVIPDMVSLNSAEARVVRSQLSFDQTKRVYDRDKKLFSEKVISKEDFEKSELQFKNDESELKAAKDNLSLTKDGITSDTKMTSNTLVRSTITGTILDIPVKKGNSVIQSNNFNDGTTIATIANMSDMLFVGKLDETEVGKVSTGVQMDITIGALEDVKLKAVLEYISPKAVEQNGAILFDMKAAVSIPDSIFIRSGYSANAEIVFQRSGKVLTVPESCVEFKNDSAFIYALKTAEPQEFERKFVRTGLSDGINIELVKGLKKGDKIRGAEILPDKK